MIQFSRCDEWLKLMEGQEKTGRYISLTASPWTTTMDYRNGLPKWTSKWTTEMDYLNGLLNGLPKWTTLNYLPRKIKRLLKLGCFDPSLSSFLGRYVMYGDT